MIEKGPTKKKTRKKGPTKVKMKGINPQKNFASQISNKVPRAYESLNPALIQVQTVVKLIAEGRKRKGRGNALKRFETVIPHVCCILFFRMSQF